MDISMACASVREDYRPYRHTNHALTSLLHLCEQFELFDVNFLNIYVYARNQNECILGPRYVQ